MDNTERTIETGLEIDGKHGYSDFVKITSDPTTAPGRTVELTIINSGAFLGGASSLTLTPKQVERLFDAIKFHQDATVH